MPGLQDRLDRPSGPESWNVIEVFKEVTAWFENLLEHVSVKIGDQVKLIFLKVSITKSQIFVMDILFYGGMVCSGGVMNNC